MTDSLWRKRQEPERSMKVEGPLHVVCQCDKCKAKQEQGEPVAWMTINAYGEEDDIHYENPEGHLPEGWTYKPLYTHPPNVQSENEPLEYWNAVEGWVKLDEVREHFDFVNCGTIYKNGGEGRVPLYTTPQQRKPLTDEEMKLIDPDGYADGLPQQIQQAPKEKNT